MAYNRENLLQRIIKIQTIVVEYKQHDVSQVTIYRRYIREQFNISYSTFNNYLAINAKAELRRLHAEKAARRISEPSLF